MHLFALLVLVFVPCCISRVVNEHERNLQDEGKSMVNGQTFKPGQEYQDPPIAGVGDEGNRNENIKQVKDDDSILEDEGKTVVNGKNGQEYQDPPIAGVGDEGNRNENIKQVKDDDSILEDEGKTVVKGKNGQEYQDPPIAGVGDEGNRNENIKQVKDDDSILEDVGKTVVNGKNAADPEQEKRSKEIKRQWVWVKLPYTSWCTVVGRQLLNYYVSAVDCHALCDNKPGCNAVEYWEQYNRACFECKDTSLIEPYTNTNDLAYPVYVWVQDRPQPVWVKFSPNTSWCTVSGRKLLNYYVMSAADCHALCDNKPGCNAVEYWEQYNDACFECTDTSLIEPYTNTNDLAYPVYVWILD